MEKSSTLDELERYASLYERGLISQAEFEEQKARLLAAAEGAETTADEPPPEPSQAFTAAPSSPRRRNSTLIVSAAALAAVIVVGGMAVWLTNRRPDTPAAAAQATPASAQPASGSSAPTLDLAEASKIAFGAEQPVLDVTTDGARLRVAYSADKLVKLANDAVALVSSGTVEDAGHVTSGYLAIHYLKWDGTAWVRAGAWPQFLEGGSFGSPGEVTTGRGLFVGPTVQLEGGWSGQGCSVSYIDLVELTPERPVLRAGQILSGFEFPDPAAEDGERGANPEEGHGVTEGKLAILAPGQSFRMTYDGDFPNAVTYVRSGETYRPTASTDGLPSC